MTPKLEHLERSQGFLSRRLQTTVVITPYFDPHSDGCSHCAQSTYSASMGFTYFFRSVQSMQ